MRRSAPPASEIRAELKALADEFFQAVSFESGERPAYGKIHDLFIDDGKLIRCSSEAPEITSVQEFIASRQHMFASGELTSFEEVETAAITEVFGNIAHQLSRVCEARHGPWRGDRRTWCHLDAIHPHGARVEDELDGVR